MAEEDDDDVGSEEEVAEEQLQQLMLALDGDLRPIAPAVFVPPGVRANLARGHVEREVIQEALDKSFGQLSYEDQVLRIERDVDPVGMAIAIAQGMAIPVYKPDKKGGVEVGFVKVSMRERMKVFHKLLDRVTPARSPVKSTKSMGEEAAEDPAGFLATVARAGEVARRHLDTMKVVEGELKPSGEPDYDEEAIANGGSDSSSRGEGRDEAGDGAEDQDE